MINILSAMGLIGSAFVFSFAISILVFFGPQGDMLLAVLLGSFGTFIGCMASLFCSEVE